MSNRFTLVRSIATVLSGVLLSNFSAPLASAHHSFVAHYLPDENVVISGVVEDFWFHNPHARIVVNVSTEPGKTERWIVETGARNVLIRGGWQGDEIQPGDLVKINGHPSRDGSNSMELRELEMGDGRRFRSGGGGLRLVAKH